jgi:hypothetical protein
MCGSVCLGEEPAEHDNQLIFILWRAHFFKMKGLATCVFSHGHVDNVHTNFLASLYA